MPDIKNAKRRTFLRASLSSALLASAGWPPALRTASAQSNPAHAPFTPDPTAAKALWIVRTARIDFL